MNLAFLLAKIAVLGGALLLVESANLASGGNIYLASVSRLAQNGDALQLPPPPSPTPSQDSSSMQSAPALMIGGESGTLPPPPSNVGQLAPPPQGGEFMPSQQPFQSGEFTPSKQPPQPLGQPFQSGGQSGQQGQPGTQLQFQQLRQPRFQFQQPQQPRFQFQFQPSKSGEAGGQSGQQQGQQPGQPSGQPFRGEGFMPSGQSQGQPQGQPFQNGGFTPPGLGGERPGQQGEQFNQSLESEFEEPMEEERVDPQEIRDVLKQIQDIQRQIKSLLRQVQKAAANSDDLARLNAMSAELNQTKATLSGSTNAGDQRDAIQEFRDSNYWEEINGIRIKIELPKLIKQFEKSLQQLKKVLKAKTTQTLGFDLGRVNNVVTEMEAELAEIKNNMASGDLEEAQELMQSFHEGKNPGEIQSVILAVREIRTMVKRARNAELSAQVETFLQQIISEFNAGNYREAREAAEELRQELRRSTQSNQKR